MKKKLIYLFTVLCSTGAFTACSNDNGNPEPEVPVLLKGENTYDGDKLALTYSDAVMPSKQIKFGTTDGKTGTLTMSGVLDLSSLLPSKSDNTPLVASGVIPGETSTIISNIELKQSGNKYTFSGTDTNDNRSVEYTGEVDSTKLTVSLKVKMATNNLLGTWNLAPVTPGDVWGGPNISEPIYSTWISETPFNLDLFGSGMSMDLQPGSLLAIGLSKMPLFAEKNGQELILSVLSNVTFKEDGNIIASYSNAENIQSPVWQNSPTNIAQYYVRENTVYLVLNTSMLLSNMTKAETSNAQDEVLQKLVTDILPMLGTGFPLTYKIDNEKLTVFAGTDLVKKLLYTILPLIKDEKFRTNIIDLVKKDPNFGSYAAAVQGMLEQLPDVLDKTTDIELGLNLVKKTN